MPPTFYMIQIVPDIDPNRVKLGWTANLPQRMTFYAVFSPTAAVAGEWFCPRELEKQAIRAITPDPCRPLSREAFHLDSIAAALERAAAFFSEVVPPEPANVPAEAVAPTPVQAEPPAPLWRGLAPHERARVAREHKGWTQADLAERAGVKLSTVKRYETADMKRPHPHMLKQVADALGVQPRDLFVPE